MSEVLNIYQKLAKVRKGVEVIQKNRDGYSYKYVSEDEILAKITGKMDKYQLSLIPSIDQETLRVEPFCTKKTKTKPKTGEMYEENVNEILVSADMTFSWVNNENPEERIEVPWALVGHQSDGSQSFGSGLTYATRYFLLKFFNIATPDNDPDEWRRKQRRAEEEADLVIAKEAIGTLDGNVRAYLSSHPEDGPVVKEFMAKYVKDGNYLEVKKSSTALTLLKEFEQRFK